MSNASNFTEIERTFEADTPDRSTLVRPLARVALLRQVIASQPELPNAEVDEELEDLNQRFGRGYD